MHERRVIHRDLKPENILVTHFHVCKICDFGEAMTIPHNNPNGRIKETTGTHQFFAPECCNQAASTVSSDNVKCGAAVDNIQNNASREFSGYAADMWACGISLFACIFGFLPFYASEPLELFGLIG